MSWWKLAISSDSVKDKLDVLFEKGKNGGDDASLRMLIRLVDALPQAQQMIKTSFIRSEMVAKVEKNDPSDWDSFYVLHSLKNGLAPWFEKMVIDLIPFEDLVKDRLVEELSRHIGIDKLDPALAAALRRHGQLDHDIFWGRSELERPIHEVLPQFHQTILASIRHNLDVRPGISTLLQRDLQNGSASRDMMDALTKMMTNIGTVPAWAMDWMEDNLDGKRHDISAEAMQEVGRGIISAFRRNDTMSPPAVKWFSRHMMEEDDQNLWSAVMTVILTPALNKQASMRLASALGPAIVAARRRGVLSSRIDEHVARTWVDWLHGKYSSGVYGPSPQEWAVEYMKVDGMKELVLQRADEKIFAGARFPTHYFLEKVWELEKLYGMEHSR